MFVLDELNKEADLLGQPPMDLAIIWYCPLQPAASRKQFVENLQGADVDGGLGVEFQVADYG